MPDISQLSDADLMAALGQGSPAPNVRSLSDADLMKALQPQSTVGGIGSEIYNAAASAANTIADRFNPYSAANAARADRLKNASFLGGMGDVAQGVLDTGKAAFAVPALAASPVTGTARSVIGRAYDALAPQFTPAQQAQLKASGVYLPSGGQVADLAMMGIRPSGANPVGPVSRAAPPPTIDQLKKAYTDVVESPAAKGAAFQPRDVASVATTVENDLIRRGFRPTQKSAPDTFAELQRLKPGAGVASINLDDLLAARRALGATAIERDQFGKATPDSVAAKSAMEKLDALIESVVPEMADANANYSAAKSAERLDFANAKAARRAAKSGSGMNLENTMRQEADKVSTRGLTPEQIAQLNQIVMGTNTRNALRIGGKLGVDGGLSLMLHGGMGYATGGTTLPVTAAGTGARMLGEALTRRAMSNLSNSIRGSSPLARQAAPIPIGAPNPLFGAIPASQLPQVFGMGFRPMLGLMPTPAEQQQ